MFLANKICCCCWIATKLAQDGPRRARVQGVLKVKVKGHVIWILLTFVISRKSLLLAGKWLERYQTCT